MPSDTEREVGQLAQNTTQQVLQRFFVRCLIALFLPLLLQLEFWPTVATLMFVGGISCSWVAIIKEEVAFGRSLNYWDESAGHFGLFCLLTAVNKAVVT